MSLAERDRSEMNLELLLSILFLGAFCSSLVLYDRANRQLEIRRPGAINENERDVISSVGLDEGRKCRWVRKNWRAHALNDERELLLALCRAPKYFYIVRCNSRVVLFLYEFAARYYVAMRRRRSSNSINSFRTPKILRI